MNTLSEQEFRVKSDEALEGVRQSLLPLADKHEFEVEFQNGVLNVLFEDPREAKFVVSPQAPVRQIWISAMSRSYKLAWDPSRQLFALNGESLADLLRRLCDEFLAIES
jgi:iron donor protein CyaY